MLKIGKILLVAAILSLSVSAGAAFAADTCYWVGTGAWTTTSNWAGSATPTVGDTCDGGGNYPSPDDSVVFDSGSSSIPVMSEDITVNGFTLDSSFGGSVSMGIFDLTAATQFTIMAGTFNAGSGTVTVYDLEQSGGTFNGQTADFNVTKTSIFSHYINGGAFNAGTGNYDFDGILYVNDHDTKDADVDFSSANQVDFAGLYIGKDTGSTGTFIFPASTTNNTSTLNVDNTPITHSDGTYNHNTSADFFLDSQSLYNVTFNSSGSIRIETGTIEGKFTWTSGGCDLTDTLTIEGEFEYEEAANGGPCNIKLAPTLAQSYSIPISNTAPLDTTFPKLIVDTNATVNITETGTIIFGNFTMNDGVFNAGSGTIETNNYVQRGGTVNGQTADFDITNSSINQHHVDSGTINAGTGNWVFAGELEVNDTTPKDADLNFTNVAKLDLVELKLGSASAATGDFKAPNASSTDGMLIDGEIWHYGGTTFTHNNGRITYDGSSDNVRFNLDQTINDLVIDKYDGLADGSAGLRVELYGNADDIEGDLIIKNGLLDANSVNHTVAGDIVLCPSAHTGVAGCSSVTAGEARLQQEGSTFTLDGICSGGTAAENCQGLYGDNNTSFYNLSKIVSSGSDYLYFEEGTGQRITGTLTLQGNADAAGNRLYLRSTSVGTQWDIDPEGTRNIDYLDVKDSNNTSGTTILAAMTGSVADSVAPNNTDWDFGPILTNVQLTSTSGNFNYPDDLSVSSTLADGTHTRTSWKKDAANYMTIFYPFDGSLGNESTETPDISGNVNDGTVSGATWSGTGGHDGNGAYSFDGVNDYIMESDFHVNNITVGAWFKTSDNTKNQRIFAKDSYELALNKGSRCPADTLCYWVRTGTAYPLVSIPISGNISNNTWYHVMASWDGDVLKLYLDGVEVDSYDSTTDGNLYNDGTKLCVGAGNQLGLDCTNPSIHFQGSIDEAMVFPMAISESEVANIYANGNDEYDGSGAYPTKDYEACITPFNSTSGSYNSTQCTGAQSVSWDGLDSQTLTLTSGYFIDGDDLTADYTVNNGTHGIVNWYKNSSPFTALYLPMDGENGDESSESTDFSDANDNGLLDDNDVTEVKNAYWLGHGGRNGDTGAYDFDGSGDYLWLDDSSSFDFTGGMSIEFWAHFDDPVGNQRIMSQYDAGWGQRGWALSHKGGSCNEKEIQFTISKSLGTFDGGAICSNPIITNGWHHVVAAFTPATSMKIYIDGVDESRAFGTGSLPSSIANSSKGIGIGGAYSSSSRPDSEWFDGQIDLVRIYPSELSAEQIASLYTNDLDVIVAEETSDGDNWKAEIFAFDNSTSGAQSPGEETQGEDIGNLPPVISNLGPASYVDGSGVSDDTPTLTFDIDEPNDENVNFQIQVDDNSDFSSPEVDYTSGYVAEGSLDYTTASLSDGAYYWRVRSTSETTVETSDWEVANSGAVAFNLSTVILGAVTQISPIGGTLTDTTPLFSWQDITGEDTYTIEVTLSGDTGFASPVLTMSGIAQDSTTKEATSSLTVGQDYIWRIYGVAGGVGDPAGASSASFSLLNVIPEFPTYLLGALMVIGFGFVLRKRINFTEMS